MSLPENDLEEAKFSLKVEPYFHEEVVELLMPSASYRSLVSTNHGWLQWAGTLHRDMPVSLG